MTDSGRFLPPRRLAGVPAWRFRGASCEMLFLGRGAPDRDGTWPAGLLPPAMERAWLHQVHSTSVIEAAAGACGDADALVVRRSGLAAMVATADCVPVVVAGRGGVVVVHAGWRGIVAGVVTAAIEALGERVGTSAWIGPAIGPCCYEVGEDVAGAVVAAATPAVLRRSASHRPHLDLGSAVAFQLARAGAGVEARIDVCTRCHPEWLWSHRRDGDRAGRNLTLAWRAPAVG